MTVYGASSLSVAFPQLDGSASYSFAGSDTLRTQIERGAPADVFAAASFKDARALYAVGRCGRPLTFATNRLVLITPRGNPSGVRSAGVLRRGRRRLAVGAAGVPIGVYTRAVLARLHLAAVLRSNLVSLEANVGSVVAKVALGSADAGFVYASDADAAGARTETVALPAWAQPPVRYQVCVVRRRGVDAVGARAFIARLRAASGRAVLHRAGFGLPPVR